MKKLFKSILLVSVSLSALFLTSCKKDDESSAPSRSGKATISGTVVGDFDKRASKAGLEWAEGIKVKVTYTNADIAYTTVDAKNTYTIVKTATTNAAGFFSIEVDTKDANVDYTVSIDDYVSNIQDDTDNFLYIFKAQSENVTGLVNGGEAFVELSYGTGVKAQGQN
jgi:hypothetical protein